MAARSYDQANLAERLLRGFGASALGARVLAPVVHHVDAHVLRATSGRSSFSGLVTGVPIVELTTIGARSGQPRTAILLGIPHPGGLAVIASNFGRHRHPGWYHNLLANPEVTIRSEGRQWRALARLASEPERDAIWSRGCAISPGWRKYERRAGGRVIEAFILNERR